MTAARQSYHVFAPAKINLSLRVGSPGIDGRHPLDSVVAFTATCGDELGFAVAPELSLSISGPFGDGLTTGEDNLVLRAAKALREVCGITAGAAISLDKRLPLASGIGGGSADAAAALLGLNKLWHCNLDVLELQAIGARLGADIPACVAGTALRMTGTGEAIEPIAKLPSLGIVLVNPLVDCPTGPVYQQYDRLGQFTNATLAPLPQFATKPALLDYLQRTPNDLEGAAIALVPRIAEVLTAISNSPRVLLARMSGSGATCFGIYEDLGAAKIAASHIKNALAFAPVWVEADQINT